MTAHPMTPVKPPTDLTDIFTDDETARLFGVMRNMGPWRLIAGIYFKSVEELLAVSGGIGDNQEVFYLSDFLTPAFRGFFGNNGIVYEETAHDLFYSKKLLDLVKGMHGAQYGARRSSGPKVTSPREAARNGPDSTMS